MIVKDMTHEECIEVLSKGRIGHLACASDNRPYVVPVQYAFEQPNLYSFSLAGQKIDWMRENPQVCIQIEEKSEDGLWRSVVVEGIFEEYPDEPHWHIERTNAWALLEKRANWWEPGAFKPDATDMVKTPDSPIFYAIRIASVTGRQTVAENS